MLVVHSAMPKVRIKPLKLAQKSEEEMVSMQVGGGGVIVHTDIHLLSLLSLLSNADIGRLSSFFNLRMKLKCCW